MTAPVDALVTQEDKSAFSVIALRVLGLKDPDKVTAIIEEELARHRTTAERRGYQAATDRAAGWQPIETAPKDGKPFQVWADGYEWPEIIRWYEYSPEDAAEAGEPGYFHYAEEALSGNFEWEHEASHWMPLPAAPEI